MKNFAILLTGTILSAYLLTLASPGNDLWFLAYFALVPMLVSARLTDKGAKTAWLFGFFYYAANITWVSVAVSDFGNSPPIIGLFAALALSGILGIFWLIFGKVYTKKPDANLLMAGVIVALEVAKSNLFSGFPMLNLSHTQYSFLPAIQIAEVTGAFGITLIIAYTNLAVTSLIISKNKQSIIFAVLLLGASFSYGFSVQHRDYAGNDIKVSIIQPAYSQADKWKPEKKYDIMGIVNMMVRDVDFDNIDLLLLPETVYPAFLDATFAGYHMLSIAGEKKPVIAGGIRKLETDGKKQYRNSVFMFNKEKTTIYDKLKLVPFGEYFPLKTIFKPIDYYFFKGAEDFTAGESATIFTTEKFATAPMICYESMYSSLVRDQVMMGADILTVVTNDSWFGDTKGPYQHLAADVMRAVEFRKPVLRAAQSGISAQIAPTGEIIKSIGLGKKEAIQCEVRTHRGLTLFATGGYGWLAVFLFVAWYINRRKSL